MRSHRMLKPRTSLTPQKVWRISFVTTSKRLSRDLMSRSISLGHGWLLFFNSVFLFIDEIFRDTVSSIGVARGPSLPETTNGMSHVCAFRHALALDERRVKFLPEYVNGGHGQKITGSSKTDIKEVWFAGSHSDMYVSMRTGFMLSVIICILVAAGTILILICRALVRLFDGCRMKPCAGDLGWSSTAANGRSLITSHL
jgi:hypothetical protein